MIDKKEMYVDASEPEFWLVLTFCLVHNIKQKQAFPSVVTATISVVRTRAIYTITMYFNICCIVGKVALAIYICGHCERFLSPFLM